MSVRSAALAAVAAALAARCTGDCGADDIVLSLMLKNGAEECSRLCTQDPRCGQFKTDGKQLCCGNSGTGKSGYTQMQGPKGCNDLGQCVVCDKDAMKEKLEKSRSDQTEVILSSDCNFLKECGADEEIEASYNFQHARLVTLKGNGCVLKGRVVSSSNLRIPGNIKMKSPEEGKGSAIFFNGTFMESSSTLITQGYHVSVFSAKATDANITINAIEPQNIAGAELDAPYALGIAHVSGHLHVNSCGDNGIAVIQEIEGDVLEADIVCNKIINLTDALQLFGLAFEIRFFNDDRDSYDYAQEFFFYRSCWHCVRYSCSMFDCCSR